MRLPAPRLLTPASLLLALSSPAAGAKLVEVRPVDQQVLIPPFSIMCSPTASVNVSRWSANWRRIAVAARCSRGPTDASRSGVIASIMARNCSPRVAS